jgi:hypothetical protein
VEFLLYTYSQLVPINAQESRISDLSDPRIPALCRQHSVLARARSSISGNPAQPHFRDSDWPGLRFDGSGDVDLGFAAPILVSIHASFFFFILVLLSARGYIFSFGVLGNFLNA